MKIEGRRRREEIIKNSMRVQGRRRREEIIKELNESSR
jgi:hypothetical protein